MFSYVFFSQCLYIACICFYSFPTCFKCFFCSFFFLVVLFLKGRVKVKKRKVWIVYIASLYEFFFSPFLSSTFFSVSFFYSLLLFLSFSSSNSSKAIAICLNFRDEDLRGYIERILYFTHMCVAFCFFLSLSQCLYQCFPSIISTIKVHSKFCIIRICYLSLHYG